VAAIALLLAAALLAGLLPRVGIAAQLDQPAQNDPPAPISPEDWARIQQAGQLIVGTSADYQPFEYYSSNFELDGFDIQLIRTMAEEMGVEVVIKDFAFGGLLDALRLGQVDAVISALSITPDRQAIVDFTNAYYRGNDAALVRNDTGITVRSASDLLDRRIGVERGTTYQHWVQQNVVDAGFTAQENLIAFEGTADLVNAVRSNSVDVAIMGYLPAQQFDRRYPELTIGGSKFNSQLFGIAVRQGSTLLTPLNEALLAVQASGDYAALVEDYLVVEVDAVLPPDDGLIPLPTPAATPLPAATPAPTPTPTPPPCIYGMSFVADLNYNDQGMTAPPVMGPGQLFTKGWRVQNSGTCEWGADFQLMYVNGNRSEARMEGEPVPVGRPVAVGEQIDLYVNLRAPQAPGVFQAFWQMRDNLGRFFGQVIWVGVQVPDPNPPPTPVPPPPTNVAVNPNLRADSPFINAGQCTTIRWDVDNVNAVYFVENGNAMGKGGHDAQSVCPGGTTTYELRVVRQDGVTESFFITITVGSNPNQPFTMSFWADSTDIRDSECTTLRWDVQGAREVYLDGEGVVGVGSREVCPDDPRTYELRAIRNDGGTETRQVSINVRDSDGGGGDSGGSGGGDESYKPGWPRIDWFKVDKNSIGLGSCVNLNWRVSDASGVNITRSGTPILQGGGVDDDKDDCPPAAGWYDYTLDAYDSHGNDTASVTVEVRP
jgi:polar amino acid transport system substrate-binding protein